MTVTKGAGGTKRKLITDFFAHASKKKVGLEKSPVKSPVTNPVEVPNSLLVSELESSEMSLPTEETASAETSAETKEPSGVETASSDYASLCSQFNFNKAQWIESLTAEEKLLLALEVSTLHISWLVLLHKELTKPYFLELKRFLAAQAKSGKTVFPPPGHIYSWSHLTPLTDVKCLILGQDPYHNFNQAHGLAFLVLEPTRPPPSLLNIYKTLKIDFPTFEAPDYKKLAKLGTPGGGNLTKWAKRGVLMLNACLTVEAHKANSHAKQGWEQFTENVIRSAITYAKTQNQGFVVMAWGTPAQKRVANFTSQLNSEDTPFLVLKSVHPSPLSASRGFFELKVFKKCNEWLVENKQDAIDWGLLEGNVVK